MAIAINGQTIADARNQAIGQTVTITGVATNGPELGPIRYIQDGTAAVSYTHLTLPTICSV